MNEVFDEVANDGIKNGHNNEDGYEKIDDIGGEMDGIPRRRYIGLIKHCSIFILVTNV